MASIINDQWSGGLVAQERIRVRLDHEDPQNVEVYFDFDRDSYLYSFYYTTDGSIPTDQSSITFPRAKKSLPYRSQIRLLIVKESDQSKEYPDPVWTPPPEFFGFNFGPDPAERPPCTNGNNDVRYFDGNIYAHTASINSEWASVVVRVRDTGTICEDVGMFYSTDGSDPDPCPGSDPFPCSFPVSTTLENTLVNYECLTMRPNQPLWVVAKAADTQQDSGGCVENHCFDSQNGDAWTQ